MHPDQKIQILLAEDNEFNQELVIELLTDYGFSVLAANNGQEVISLLDQHTPDFFQLILMDLEMPVMDGHQATLAIRQQTIYEQIPILALTAHEEQGTKIRCLAEGMQDYLIKPFDPDKLRDTIHYWIKRASTEQQVSKTEISKPSDFPAFRHIDTSRGLHSSAHNQQLYLQLLRRFESAQRVSIRQIQSMQVNAVFDQDFLRLIHTIKGVSATIGALSVADLAAQIEIATKNVQHQSSAQTGHLLTNLLPTLLPTLLPNSIPQSIHQLLQQLVDELLNVLNELTAYFQQLPVATTAQIEPNNSNDMTQQSVLKQTLENLLKNSDPEALNYFETHQRSFANIFNKNNYAKFQNAIENYDFDFAQHLLSRNQ
jgi:CheY-like chemotaxis protein